MPKQLTVHNATVTTAAVEVKTLTISGKQVTLAVFRQLREEPLIAEDGTLNGVPWGYVNYHPDKCDTDTHMHYVWQKGDELVRGRVQRIPSFDPKYPGDTPDEFFASEANRLLTSRTHEWLHGRIDRAPLRPSGNFKGYYSAQRSIGAPFGFPVQATASPLAVAAADGKHQYDEAEAALLQAVQKLTEEAGPYSGGMEWRVKHEAEARDAAATVADRLRVALAALDDEVKAWAMSPKEVTDALTATARAEGARRQRHRDVRKALADLPQLFIAV